MYFKFSLRNNPKTNLPQAYYRLVESYRNELNRICHRTLVNVGFIDYEIETLNTIRQLLQNKFNRTESLFETNDLVALKYADIYWQNIVESGKIDVSDIAFEKAKRMMDVDTIKHKDVREIGAEWLCFQATEQLKINQLLVSKGWEEEQIQLAITQIISRAVYPFSENRTARIIKENSAVCEITGYPIDKITKDKLYKSALDLYEIKDDLEQYLSKRTNELFDLQDKIIIYDLTNTYFEGRKADSALAKFGRSKEKRSDAKLIVLALVVNVEGFIKYSSIFEGNKGDSQSLPEIIDKIRVQTSEAKRAVVVIDAGIATKENLALIEAKGYDYVCVSREKFKNYTLDSESKKVELQTQNKQKVSLQKIESQGQTDYIVKVESEGKQTKERSMKEKFEERFSMEIEKIRASLSKTQGVKKADKVHQRIGRAVEKYPSIAKLYKIEVKTKDELATEIILHPQESQQKSEDNLGVYFIRTNMKSSDESTLWTIYNTIREIESTFRCLKTDLDLRPIYHKNDDATLAHLHLGLLAYWLVNTIRHQLKTEEIKCDWQEIKRIANTQKVITTTGKNTFDKQISIRRCSEPNENLRKLYEKLGYKNHPFSKRKSVVHKTELKKNKTPILQDSASG